MNAPNAPASLTALAIAREKVRLLEAELAAALTNAPNDIKEALEEEVDIYGDGFDDYVALGSEVNVGARRTLIAATTAVAAITAATGAAGGSGGSSGGGNSNGPSGTNNNVAKKNEEEERRNEKKLLETQKAKLQKLKIKTIGAKKSVFKFQKRKSQDYYLRRNLRNLY